MGRINGRRVARALAVAVAVLGCSSLADLPAQDGSVEISFVNTTHLTFDLVEYRISSVAGETRLGSINLTNPAATPSVHVGALPEGEDYLVQLTATSTSRSGFCYGAAAFDVVGGRATPVSITLVCTGARKVRTIMVNGMTDYCPSLASYAASPPEAPVGGTIELSATAFSFYSDPLKFGWEATSGTLSSTTSAVATYTCTEPGTHALTVHVTDGLCPDFATLEVTCLPAAPGG